MHDICVHVPRKYSKLEFDSDVQIQGPVSYRIRVNRPGRMKFKQLTIGYSIDWILNIK